MSRLVDLSGLIHLFECDLCCGADVSVGDVYCRADLRRLRGDLFAESDMPDVPVVR
jgi:hypothetical protein